MARSAPDGENRSGKGAARLLPCLINAELSIMNPLMKPDVLPVDTAKNPGSTGRQEVCWLGGDP